MESPRVVIVGDQWGVRFPSFRQALQSEGVQLLPCSGSPYSGCPPLAGGVCSLAADGPKPDVVVLVRRRGGFDLSMVCAEVLDAPALVIEEGSSRPLVRTSRGVRIGRAQGAGAALAAIRSLLPLKA
jgi:hypothetical protein